MKRKATLRFYTITQCGYFGWGSNMPAFGSIGSVLNGLQKWGVGQTLNKTRLTESQDEMPIYLADLQNDKDWWLLTLWNQVPSDDGNVPSMPASAKVGSASPLINKIQSGSIPGFATYFLFLPKLNAVASVRITETVMGTESMKRYIHEFMATAAPEASTQLLSDGSAEVLGYIDPSSKAIRADVRPRIELSMKTTGNQAAFIKANSSRVRTIVRIRTLQPNQAGDRQLWQKFLHLFDLANAPQRAEGSRIKYSMNFSGTKEEIATIVDANVDSVEPRIDDVGFVLAGESQPHWLSGSVSKLELELELSDSQGMFDAKQILEQVRKRSATVLREAK